MSEKELQDEVTEVAEIKTENTETLKELESIDFSSEDLDVEKYFTVLESKERDKKLAESFEAENTIKGLAPIYLDEECSKDIDTTIKAIEDLVDKYNVEKDLIKNMDRSEKDKVFAIVKHFNLKLANTINAMNFNITFKRDELTFMINAFKNISYNGNDVLMIADSGLNPLLQKWIDLDKNIPKNVDTLSIDIDIRNLVILYQFLSKHSVKGLGKGYITFTNILNKIKDANDLFNAFNVIRERVNSKFLVWAGATNTLDEETENTIQGEVLEPEDEE